MSERPTCDPHDFKPSPMTGAYYCTRCFRSPVDAAIARLEYRMDQMQEQIDRLTSQGSHE